MLDASVNEGEDDEGDNLMTHPNTSKSERPSDVPISSDLTPEQKIEVSELVEAFPDVFTDTPGLTYLIEHDIRTVTETPIRLKPYPLPYAITDQVYAEIENMIDMKVIEPSESAYSSPIVLVKKKDQTFRFCIDLRALNRITMFDAEPMPNIKDLLSKLSGQIFLSIRFVKGVLASTTFSNFQT